jgi:hypothetical protein
VGNGFLRKHFVVIAASGILWYFALVSAALMAYPTSMFSH